MGRYTGRRRITTVVPYECMARDWLTGAVCYEAPVAATVLAYPDERTVVVWSCLRHHVESAEVLVGIKRTISHA